MEQTVKNTIYKNRNESKRISRIQNRIAIVFIWITAAISFGVLSLIVEYVVVNGIVTIRSQTKDILPVSVEHIPLDTYPGALHLHVRKDMRLDSLQYDQVKDILTGKNRYWGYISGQNRNVAVVLYDDADFIKAMNNYFIPAGESVSDHVIISSDPVELESIISSHKGVIFFAPNTLSRKEYGFVRKRLKTVPLQEYMIVVNEDVTALRNGQRLSSISWEKKEVEELFSGRISNWSQLGYTDDLPVKLVLPPPGGRESYILSRFEDYFFSNPETSVSYRDFSDIIFTHPGAVGIASQKYVQENNLSVLKVEYIERKLNLRPAFLFESPSRAGAVGGISVVILNTIAMVIFVLLIATPIGLAGAVYISEYAAPGRYLKVLRIGIDTLSGIPSIIFGLFGYVFFSGYLGLKTGLLSGAFTLTIMILPTIIRTSEEAIRSVPEELRHGSFALGATKHQTIWKIVIPAAIPGILTGVILGIGRAIGETAALLFTMGSNLSLLKSLNSPMRVLSIHLYMLIRENVSIPNAFATATILIVFVFLVNFSTKKLIGKVIFS